MASPAEEGPRNWLELPPEVTALIFSRLTAEDTLTRAQFVCKAWLEVSKDPLVWKRIDMSKLARTNLNVDELFRFAVHRSCGQAIDVSLNANAVDYHLEYITHRSRGIKRLRLKNCDEISEDALFEAVEKLPDLEDLEFTFCDFFDDTVEAIGERCQRLRAFKLNSIAYMPDEEDFYETGFSLEDYFNCDAIAIGMSMPGLKRLKLIGNTLTNTGLEAILDGCPELESLDLRGCMNVRLDGKIWEKCVERVKRLRLPRDYDHSDYHFVRSGNDVSFVKRKMNM